MYNHVFAQRHQVAQNVAVRCFLFLLLTIAKFSQQRKRQQTPPKLTPLSGNKAKKIDKMDNAGGSFHPIVEPLHSSTTESGHASATSLSHSQSGLP